MKRMKMKPCGGINDGIHLSEMTSTSKQKCMGGMPIFNQVFFARTGSWSISEWEAYLLCDSTEVVAGSDQSIYWLVRCRYIQWMASVHLLSIVGGYEN